MLASPSAKSKVASLLVKKTKERLAVCNRNERAGIINDTVLAIRPIIDEHIKRMDEWLAKTCASVGKK